MNKRALTEALKELGIIVQSYEFGVQGYTLDLKLDINKASGWEDLEAFPFVGLEIANTRTTGAYTRKVHIIPTDRKEFIDYIRKHMKYFCVGKVCALSDLRETIEKFGSKNAKVAVYEYLRREKFSKN